MKRLIVRIDEEKCDGCGACVPNCAEGALQIVDGKARLVSDILCDGLGACLGHCPVGALIVEEREAPAFDEEAVREHLERQGREPVHAAVAHQPRHAAMASLGGCPGSLARTIERSSAAAVVAESAPSPSELGQWPVQLSLIPVRAPYLNGADLLLAADCAPFAYAGFHRDLLRGRALAIGCPKLDDAKFYIEKLAAILKQNDIRGITVAHMEVPCCFGLAHVAKEAMKLAGKTVPVRDVTITVDGRLLE